MSLTSNDFVLKILLTKIVSTNEAIRELHKVAVLKVNEIITCTIAKYQIL